MYQKSIYSLVIVFLISPFFLYAQSDTDQFILNEYVQKITFLTNENGNLNAQLTVTFEVESLSDQPAAYQYSMLMDDNSSINEITKTSERGKVRKIRPVITDYESNGIFHSDLKLCYFEDAFSEKGQRKTYQYSKVYTDVKFFDPLFFSNRYPVERSIIQIDVPNWVQLRQHPFHFEQQAIETNQIGTAGAILYTFQMVDISPMEDLQNAPSKTKIEPHLILTVDSYEHAGKDIALVKDVSDLYAWYASLVGNVENEIAELKPLVEELIADKENDLERIEAIWYWVQDNIRYIAFEEGIMGFQPESCQKVLYNRYGDCKGMANLTKQMLILAGYDARLTWLGTNDLPYDYTMPSLIVDNHMICTVLLDGNRIFLDATEKYADLYNYAYRIRGKEVLIENGDQFILDTIPAAHHESNRDRYTYDMTIQEDQLTGVGSYAPLGNRKTTMLNYLAADRRDNTTKNIEYFLSEGNKNIQVELHQNDSLADRRRNPVLRFEVTADNKIIDLGNELYVNPEMGFEFNEYEIEVERTIPFEFSNVYAVDYNISLSLPEGWQVNYLPEAVKVQTSKYSFLLNYTASEDRIQYHKTIIVNDTWLGVDEFSAWNETIDKVSAFYDDQIILQSKDN